LQNNKLTKLVFIALPFIASSLMLTVIQPPTGISVLAWFAYVPFILACSPDTNPKIMVIVSWLIAFLYWLGNLNWIEPITIIGWIVLCLYTAMLWPILALSFRYFRRKKVPLFIASAVLIVGTERMQGFFLGGFFWRFLGHSQYQNTTIIQIADIFGAGGVSFLIAMVNGLLAEFVIAYRKRIMMGKGQETFYPSSIIYHLSDKSLLIFETILVALAIAGCIFYGKWRISQEKDCISLGPVAAGLQSNVPQSVKNSFQAGDELFDELMVQSKQAAQAGAKLIVWPETMVQAYLDSTIWPYLKDANEAKRFDKILKEHAKDTAYLLVGGYGAKINDTSFGMYNSAFLYTADGQRWPEIYNKIHLVPFGEVLPFRKTFPALYKILMKFTPYDFDYSLDYGSQFTIFRMKPGKQDISDYNFGVLICYEDTVPELGRKFALGDNGKKRIDWLINISNDGWFVQFRNKDVIPSTEQIQHAAVCAFRAVENRIPVLRSVNTGISCLIDSSGRIKDGFIKGTLPKKAADRKGMAGWYVDTIPIDSRTSFFSKYGEWLDFCCQGCVLILIISAVCSAIIKYVKKRRFKGS
jgi:apolipoprotein N-acyltransferase